MPTRGPLRSQSSTKRLERCCRSASHVLLLAFPLTPPSPGANGAGKSTLLRVLAGKHLVPRDSVQLCGASPFHDTWLTVDGALAYIGGTWQKEVAFAGYSVPLQGDFAACKMLDAVPCSAERRAAIYTALDVDPTWRMHKVSDGQRRRVQLAYGLLRPYQVLLLDEVTVDLDVLGRAQLMDFVRADCDARGAVVIYVTHIFCGLGGWATHYALLEDGRVRMLPAAQALKPGQSLLTMVEQWLRAGKARLAGSQAPALHCGAAVVRNNGWAAGRLMPTRAPDVRGDESANLGTA